MEYETRKYLDYFVIDEGYYPEINESSIKDPKNRWQNTFPHKDIVALLRLTERALSRSDKKSLWLEGSYGTGKSRIIWMMQNLLTCPENEFDDYFDEYENLRKEIDLRERLRTVRRLRVVTATRYATGDITSTQKLIFAVFESLTAALRRAGCKFDGAKTLRGKIASWLEADAANLEMFRAKIRKPEYRYSASLANRSAEEIINRLKSPQAEVSQLVEDILNLGDQEGIRAFNIDMKDLTEWIAEVIAENNLKALVLFWDEFSKFFANNRNNLDEFQRLAELSNIAPFYLIIATHGSDSLAGEGDQAFRIVSDRFTHVNITMPDHIALELIGHALKVKDVAKENWNAISAALRERTAEPRKVVMDFAKIKDEKILTDILPIHPMTAILLKNLAAYFASNQRSIFNYIKNSDPEIKAFQDFIATKSPDDGDLVTIDCLWNFFYESGTDEHGGNVGRMNLKPSIRAILDSYSLNKKELTHSEQIVLKTVLLFQAIDQESHGEIDIFQPTEKNLELAFTGVADMENGRAVSIAIDLTRKDILFKKPGKVETFAAAALSGDFAEIERLRKIITDNIRTAELVNSVNLTGAIPLTAAQKSRYALTAVTADNFTFTVNKISNEAASYKINAVVCFARNEDEQNKLHRLIGDAIRNDRYHRLVFIDASSNLINRDVFERYIDHAANEKYWRGKDNALANKMRDDAADCLKEWYNTFDNGSFVYYPATADADDERRGTSCQSVDMVIDSLRDNVRRLYPYAIDGANITDTLFAASQLKALAKLGSEQKPGSMLNVSSIKLVWGDLWQMSGKYWEVYPDLNISQLKIEIDKFITDRLEEELRVSFDDIFGQLLERGFMPVNIYAALTGFLLKEYADEPYRYSAGIDAEQGGAMTVQKLAECIGDSMAQFTALRKSRHPKYLEIMSPNQKHFMIFAADVFNLTEDVSVEKSAQKLRLKSRDLGCPLWCYVDAAEARYKKFLGLLANIANSKQEEGISSLAEQAGQFLIENPAAFTDLKRFLTVEVGREIFTEFLKQFEDGIIFELAQQIGVEHPVSECLKRVATGDDIWLHDRETAEGDLKNFIIDYKIIAASRRFGIEGVTFKACVRNWADHCRFNLKIPADVLGDYNPSLKNFFEMLKEMTLSGELPQGRRKAFLEQLTDNAEHISKAFSKVIDVLSDKYSYQLGGLNNDEIKQLYASLPNSSFTDSQRSYRKNIDEFVKDVKGKQLKNELNALWQSVAGALSPREWSKHYRTPILAMLPASELEAAQAVFDTVMSKTVDEKSMQVAAEYLQTHSADFDDIKNGRNVEEVFKKVIVGENAVLLDNDEVRDKLEAQFKDVYHWYPSVRVKDVVKAIAQAKYYSGGAYDKLTARVAKMSEESVRKLLLNLLDKNYEVGLAILKES